MKPNIKQRNHTAGHTNRGKPPSRKKAAEIFDKDAYKQRAFIEAIWSRRRDKESQATLLYAPLAKNRKRFGKILSITWNINVLNRFICAHKKGKRFHHTNDIYCYHTCTFHAL